MRLYIDIETIPSQRADVRDRLHERVLEDAGTAMPPSNYRKEEAITKWRIDHITGAPARADEQWRQTSLDGGYGELCCVCWAWDDEPILEAAVDDDDEASVLRMLFLDLANRHAGSGGYSANVVWAGHNIEFDLRFLHHRAIILGVRPHFHIPHNDPPWKGTYIDTMREWAGLRGTVKLTVLCDMLGIDISADDIDGSQVWDAYQAGRIADIAEHCRRDVERVRRIVKRLRWET